MFFKPLPAAFSQGCTLVLHPNHLGMVVGKVMMTERIRMVEMLVVMEMMVIWVMVVME